MITSLKPHEVFVFGSNAQGFHGAGAAGLACRGESRNTWRQDQWFLKALKSPPYSQERIGKWAILGQAIGLQQGQEGRSYAIVTITKPGVKRSTPLAYILKQVLDLVACAQSCPSFTFLLTPLGTGYAGYSKEEMIEEVWKKVGPLPKNFDLTHMGEGYDLS